MPLSRLQFRPGINREVTSFANEGGWVDGDKVRFRAGFPETIGGWSKFNAQTFLGTTRALHPWVTLTGKLLLGFGTNLKYYVMEGGVPNDITPIRRTAAAGAATFAATDGSSVLTVTDTLHGAIAGAYVTFSATTSLGGAITATVLNAEYQITAVLSSSTYEIDVGVNANASDVGDGGAGTIAAYQINPCSTFAMAAYSTGTPHLALRRVGWKSVPSPDRSLRQPLPAGCLCLSATATPWHSVATQSLALRSKTRCSFGFRIRKTCWIGDHCRIPRRGNFASAPGAGS